MFSSLRNRGARQTGECYDDSIAVSICQAPCPASREALYACALSLGGPRWATNFARSDGRNQTERSDTHHCGSHQPHQNNRATTANRLHTFSPLASSCHRILPPRAVVARLPPYSSASPTDAWQNHWARHPVVGPCKSSPCSSSHYTHGMGADVRCVAHRVARRRAADAVQRPPNGQGTECRHRAYILYILYNQDNGGTIERQKPGPAREMPLAGVCGA